MLAFAFDKANRHHVLLQHTTDSREDRRDVFALHPCTTTRVEYSLQLFDNKGHITTATEHSRHHAGQCNGPRKVLHVFGVDEDLERTAVACDHNVIDGDIDRMLAIRPFDLVGVTFEGGRTVQRLGHVDDFRIGRSGLWCLRRRLVRRFRHRQNRTRHIVRTVGGAALTACLVSFHVDFFERVKVDVFGAVDGFRNRRVDPFLRSRLHPHVSQRRERLSVHKVARQFCVCAEFIAVEFDRVIDDFFFGARTVFL